MRFFQMIMMLFVFFSISCGSGSSGTITATLNVDALSSGEQDSIENFIFIVTSGQTSVLYPSNCLSADGNNACIEENCGFGRDESTFDPGINFDDFDKDATLTVTACALDEASNEVAAGSAQVSNSDGQSATITMSQGNTCTGLPNICP